jgi:hypothetical protein
MAFSLAAGQSGGARHDRELLQDGVQHGDPVQPAGGLWLSILILPLCALVLTALM